MVAQNGGIEVDAPPIARARENVMLVVARHVAARHVLVEQGGDRLVRRHEAVEPARSQDLCAAPARELQGEGIHERDATRGVETDGDGPHGLEHTTEARLLLTNRRRRRALDGDVAKGDGHGIGRGVAGAHERPGIDGDEDPGAIVGTTHADHDFGLCATRVERDEGRMRFARHLASVLVEDAPWPVEEPAPDHVRGPQSQDALPAGVEHFHQALRIDDRDAFTQDVHDGVILRFGVARFGFRAPLRADVAEDGACRDGLSVHDPAVGLAVQGDAAPIASHEAELHDAGARGIGAGEQGFELPLARRARLRREQLLHGEAAGDVVVAVAQDVPPGLVHEQQPAVHVRALDQVACVLQEIAQVSLTLLE